jgi:hypothetical protein
MAVLIVAVQEKIVGHGKEDSQQRPCQYGTQKDTETGGHKYSSGIILLVRLVVNEEEDLPLITRTHSVNSRNSDLM